MNKFLKSSLATLSLLSLSIASANSAPLLMEGKTTLYQRVLTTPSCRLKSDVNAKDGKKVNAFSRFYVYEDDGKTIKVGPDDTGKISGYLDKDCTVQWKMQTALMFTNPANRNRALIFKNKNDITSLIADKNIASVYKTKLDEVVKKGSAKGVVSIEPEHYVDYKKQFYLLPILDFEESMFDDGNYVRALKIASITKSQNKKKSTDNSVNALKTFKAAIVFVIDSSISMQPYIDRTKKTINAVSEHLKAEGLTDSVHFGLVSFRSNTKAVPSLEYTSKVFVKPGEATDVNAFSEKLKDLSQANVSSKYFDEDAYAGINTALEQVDWSKYGGRYIVLITDAGSIRGSDKLSTTGLDAKELRVDAKQKGVAIYTMHLLTDSGKRNNNHESAKEQYVDLSFNETINKPLYYPVNAGDVKKFGQKIDELSSNISNQVKMAAFGKSAIGYSTNGENKSMAEDTIALGHAMQLAYLGSKLNTKTPDFMYGWLLDRDAVNHQKATSTPVVLLTKSQLSSLKDVTQKILDAANEGMLEPEKMFSSLRSVAVSLGRDPDSVSNSQSSKIAELGLLGEYLDDLPYKSRIQELDEDTWSSMGPDEQNQTIYDLESKLKYYQLCNDDLSRWVKLNPLEDASEAVYPVPLEILP